MADFWAIVDQRIRTILALEGLRDLSGIIRAGRVMAGQIVGTLPLASLPGHNLFAAKHPDIDISTPPTDGQVLAWNAARSKWVPITIVAGGPSATGGAFWFDDEQYSGLLVAGGF